MSKGYVACYNDWAIKTSQKVQQLHWKNHLELVDCCECTYNLRRTFQTLRIFRLGELVDNRKSVFHVPINPYLHTYYFLPLAMLILCVYGLWEQSKLVGGGIAVFVVGLVSTAIILRDMRPVSNRLGIAMC